MSEQLEPTSGEALAHRIGRYRVLRVLGEGGMGIVYAAFDDELARPVALKLVRRGEGRADDVRREAQAMARLSHANVVQVYDVGEHEGALFLAMELIHGQTLDAWLGELGPARVRGPRWREIVEVFVAAGRGLAAAHAANLVHGDFKPANVFVGAGVVKVGDFGLARARLDVETASDTEPRSGLGTPAYLAPEQLLGRPGTPASDQFAFCVALHEGLLGRRPFAGTDLRTLAANVLADRRAGVPERGGVPAWLIAVLDRALAREPAARWPSMDALLDALLDDPAKRRRRRRVLALAGFGLASLATVLGLREVQHAQRCEALASAIDEAWNPALARTLAATFERSGAPESARTFTRAAAGIDAWTSRWRHARARVCDEAREAPALAQRAASCLEHERWQLDALLDVFAQADRAIVLDAVLAVSELPDLSRCEDPTWLQSDASLAADALADDEGIALRRELARVLALEQTGRHADALALAETCVAAARERGDALVEADALAKLGGIRWRMADFEGAERELVAGHLLAARLGHDHVAYATARDLAWVVGVRLARIGEGRLWLELARAARVRSGIDPEQDAELHEREAELDVAAGQHDAALVAYRRALALREQTLGHEHPLTAESHVLIARSEAARGELEPALASLARGRELAIATLGPAHPIVANADSELGSVLFASGRMADSEAALRRALAVREAALGPDDPGLANILVSLAAVLEAEGELLESLLLLERAVAILERQLGREHPDAIVAGSTLATIKGELGQIDEAIALLRELATRAEHALGPADPTLGLVLANLAYYLDARGEHDEATPLRRRVVAIDEATLEPDDPELANDLVLLARDELAIGEHAAALAAARRALTILEALPEADADTLARARATLVAIEQAHPL
jgi:tetratricopeptide (TPR) repeat protein